MKILHLSNSDFSGGAAKAAFRLNCALNDNKKLNVNSKMRVLEKKTNEKSVYGSYSKKDKFLNKFKCSLSQKFQKIQFSENKILHSSSIFPSFINYELNKNNYDLINLHWIQGEMISIEEIGRIKKPIVWTLHDAWPFCGTEHFPNGLNDKRYEYGYFRSNKSKFNKGFDLDRWAWERKRKSWNNHMTFVSPSRWIDECAKKSKLLINNDFYIVPHSLPLDIFKPSSKKLARETFNLPKSKKLILFGAFNPLKDDRKGWEFLEPVLSKIFDKFNNISFVVFGNSANEKINGFENKIISVGKLNDEKLLALLYSAADIMVVPSKIESFGQTASEAQACGVPVVAFNATGLKDVIKHKQTGFLAKPYNWEEIYEGIVWLLNNEKQLKTIKTSSRKRAESLWNPNLISTQYYDIYKKVLNYNNF